MTYAPTTILDLRAYLMAQTDLRPNALGIVGDSRHRRGYHLGRDRIYSASGQGAADYSVKTGRDRAGLSNAASALDIGNHADLRALSTFLVASARAGAPDSEDLREIIYTPDGKTVLRWDRERGMGSAPRPDEADDSHLWHTHVSWYRDSESRAKVALFRRFYEGDSEEDMRSFPAPDAPSNAIIRTGAWLYVDSSLAANPANVQITPGRAFLYLGKADANVHIVAYDRDPAVAGAVSMFVAAPDVTRIERITEDCRDEVAAAVAPLRAEILTYQTRIQRIRAKVKAGHAAIDSDIAND